MDKITVLFTRRQWNPVSWLIRWAMPRSRFSLGLSSHCLIVDGDYVIEAHMLHGVRRVPEEEAMVGLTIVKLIEYSVADALAGIEWAREQVGDKYDWLGAFGLCLEPARDWQAPGEWFCYELAAGAISHAGRDAFADYGHITENTLLAIKP